MDIIRLEDGLGRVRWHIERPSKFKRGYIIRTIVSYQPSDWLNPIAVFSEVEGPEGQDFINGPIGYYSWGHEEGLSHNWQLQAWMLDNEIDLELEEHRVGFKLRWM